MNETEKNLVQVVLMQEAQIKALRLVIGFVLSDNPIAFYRLKQQLETIDDMTLQFPITEEQRECLRQELQLVVLNCDADPYRTRIGS